MRTLFPDHNFSGVVDDFVARRIGLEQQDVGSIQVNCVHSSLFVFNFGGKLRNGAIRVVNSSVFTIAILVAIISNSVLLMLHDPGLEHVGWLQDALMYTDFVFLGFFALEMVVKVVAYGFIAHSKSYLRVSWNILDFIVVVSGFVALGLGGGSNFNALRVVRVLRPLRTVARVQSLRHILTRLMNSLPRMVDVFLLLTFICWVFDIFGVQLFMGTLHQRCYADTQNYNTTSEMFLNSSVSNEKQLTLINNDSSVCSRGSAGYHCTSANNGITLPQECRVDLNQYSREILQFDNLFTGFLYSFKIVCRDNWPDDLNDLGNAVGEAAFAYFLCATLFAGYFCVNLFIAVLSSAFSKKGDDEVIESATARVSFATVLGGSAISDATGLLCTLKPHSRDDEIDFNELPAIPTGDPFEDDDPEDGVATATKTPPSAIKKFFMKRGVKKVRVFVKSRGYNAGLMLAISLNAIVLSMDRHDAPYTLTQFIDISSFVFNIFFILDAVVKLLGLGPSYFRSGSNVFDFVLCLTSIPDLAAGTSSPYSSLRAFRLIRLLKVAQNWKNLQRLLRLVLVSVQSVASLSLVALIIIYIYTILGFQLFRTSLDDMRFSFANVFDSFLTVFVIVTGENWASIMKGIMLRRDMWAVIYFLTLVFFGNFVLTNLFIAIILENFGGDGDDEEENGDALALASAAAMGERSIRGQNFPQRQLLDATAVDANWSDGEEEMTTKKDPASIANRLKGEYGTSSGTGSIFQEFVKEHDGVVGKKIVGDCTVLSVAAEKEIAQLEQEQTKRLAANRARSVVGETVRRLMNSTSTKKKGNPVEPSFGFLGKAKQKMGRHKTIAERDAQDKQWRGLNERAWFCIPPTNKARVVIGKVLKHPVTEWSLVLLTLLSSIFLAIENPRLKDTNPGLNDAIFEIDIFFVVIFGIEALIKMFALGGFFHKGAYFRSVWNVIDFVVLVTSALALFYSYFKVGRALRVLRLTNLSFSLRVILTALVSAVPGMGSVFVLCFLLWWIYAVLGVSLFKGALYHCTDPNIFEKVNCNGTYTYTEQLAFGTRNATAERVWEPIVASSTFDGIETSMYSLLKLSLSDGWFDIMYRAVDSTSAETGPKINNSPQYSLYFITFMLFGNFFAVNLFVGVLVDRFVKHKKKGEGYSLMTEVQQQWVLAQKVLLRSRIPVTPQEPTNSVRRWCFHVAQNKAFDWFFTGMILLSSVFLSMYYYGMDPTYKLVLDWGGTAIVVLFTIEMIIKVLALNPKVYWRDSWNRVDCIIVLLSWVGFGIGSGTSVVHVFRVARLFLLLRKMRGLQTLFITLFQALPELCNVAIVLAVLYFIFAVVGVELFGSVEKISPINYLLNFDDVWHALMLLYVVTTTEGWGEVTDALRSADGGGAHAYPYMVIFMLLMAWIMMNLLVTVVIDNFSEAEIVEGQEAAFKILELFREKWIVHDTTAKHRLHVNVILKILPTMPNSIWDRSMMTARSKKRQTPWVCMLRQLEKLHIPIDSNDNVLYDDCIASLALRLFSITVDEAIVVSQRTVYGVTWNANKFSVHHYFAAKLMTKTVRKYIATRKERMLESQLRDLRDQHAIFLEEEVGPLRESHRETSMLARWLTEKLAEERRLRGQELVDPAPEAEAAPKSSSPRKLDNGREMLHVCVCSDDSSDFSDDDNA